MIGVTHGATNWTPLGGAEIGEIKNGLGGGVRAWRLVLLGSAAIRRM